MRMPHILLRPPIVLLAFFAVGIVGSVILPVQGRGLALLMLQVAIAWTAYRIWIRAGFGVGSRFPKGTLLLNLMAPVCWLYVLLSLAQDPWPVLDHREHSALSGEKVNLDI